MTGGRIVVNGRCPAPPPGVQLRPLSKKEVSEINGLIEDENMHVPSDAVCLTPQEGLHIEPTGFSVSSDDLSNIGLTGEDPQLRDYETVTRWRWSVWQRKFNRLLSAPSSPALNRYDHGGSKSHAEQVHSPAPSHGFQSPRRRHPHGRQRQHLLVADALAGVSPLTCKLFRP